MNKSIKCGVHECINKQKNIDYLYFLFVSFYKLIK